MVTSGLESVFICHPIDGEDDAIGSGERIRSFGHGADILRFGSNLFLVATFRHFGPIGRLETVLNITEIDGMYGMGRKWIFPFKELVEWSTE